ncbi:MAG: tetratricopeptide repeat protein [Ignavibacteriaceae bacterium]|nr:tetratricopeptide repeat protein [Ignavibacteriaceae bacterium]
MKSIKKKKSNKSVSKGENNFFVYLLLLVIVPFVLYFRVIHYNYTDLDDASLIKDNYDLISNPDNIPKAFTTDAFFSHRSSFYRPIQTVSFMIDSQISGQDPWAYHFTNLFLHVLIVIALFIFFKKSGFREEVSFLLALLYAVHPLITNAVCWIPAQGDLYLILFGLLSFIAFINYYNSKKTKHIIFHALFFLLACFAKETALVFPLLFSLYFYYFQKKKNLWKEIIPFPFIWVSSLGIYFLLRTTAISVNDFSSISGITAIIKNLPAIPTIFGKFFIPQDLTTMPLFNSLSVIIGISAIIISIWVIAKNKLYSNPYLILGVIWFLGFTLPPLYYRLRLAEFSAEYFEHRSGLPIIGLLLIAGIFISTSLKALNKKILNIIIPVLLIFIILAFLHSKDYTDPMAFFTSAINSNPENVSALNLRGNEYFHSGNIELALGDFENSIKICPVYSSPYYNEGILYHSTGDDRKAEYSYSQALKYDTLWPGVTALRYGILYNFAGEKLALKKFDEAKIILKKAATEFPDKSDIYSNLGYIYYSTARYDSAIYYYSKAIEFQPSSAFYYSNRAGIKYSLKDFAGALSDYSKALELDPGSAGSWYNTGNTKIELNDIEGAISDFSTVIRMNPKWGEAYYRRSIAYSKINKPEEARKDWVEAQKLGYKEIANEK